MHRRLLALMAGSAVATLLTASGSASAQVAQEEATPLEPLSVIGSSGGAAANATTIDATAVQTYGRNKIDDVLRATPGVFTRQNAQQPGVAVNIRGFEGSGRVNMMIDGVRQSFRFTGHEAAGFTYVDPNLLAGIDIMRGEVTTTGGGALAGSVNFRTLDVDDILLPGKAYGGLGRLSWGSNGVDFSEMAAAGVRTDRVDFAGAISRRQSDDYKDGDGEKVAGTSQDLLSGLVKAKVRIGDDQELSLGGVFYDNDFFANSYDQTVKNNTLSVKYRYNPDSPLIDLTSSIFYNNLKMHYTGGTGSAVGRKIEDEGIGFNFSNVSLFDLGDVGVRTANGVEYFHDQVTSEDGGVNPADGKSSTGGAFTETTFRYGMFDLTGGLRYGFYSLEGSGTPNDTYGSFNVDKSEGSFDPKITLAVNVTPWLQPYVTWGRSMRAPTTQETMLGGSHPGSVSGVYVPNPDLDSETSQGWEFGANLNRGGVFRADDVFTARANYFVKNVKNYIAAYFNASERGFQFVNVDGTTKVKGFELEARYDIGVAFASVGYTHMSSDLPSQMPGLGASQYMPDDVLTLEGGARFLERKLTVGGRYSYVSEGLVANAGSAGATAARGGDPYRLVDVYASYAHSENLTVSGKVSNLFDKQYTPFLSTTGAGQGRTFYLTTQLRF
ncbi:TonB-dependent receptor domain-containing protein [Methylopila henanensis]|uniref:TonB-dependent receptor domain-containing protein n=1 Tax=Methylopila henanensis TaxID=873516 RepID=A0ABW4K9S9_9HYPH